MPSPRSTHWPGDGQAHIEALVRAARHYVHPTADLRPRVLEAAREYCEDRRAEQKLGSFAVVMFTLALLASPAMNYLNLLRSTNIAAAREVQDRAVELENHREFGTHWALAEAFSQVRHLQASRLNHSQQRMK